MVNFLFVGLGLVLGLLYGILFFQMDNTWKKISWTVGSNTGFIAGVLSLFSIFSIDLKVDRIAASTCFVFSFLVALLLLCIYMTQQLNAQNEKYKLRLFDFIIGFNSTIKDYYECKKTEIGTQFIVENEKLNKIKRDREKLESEILSFLKEKERYLLLIEEMKTLSDKCCCLPIKSQIPFPLNKQFLESAVFKFRDLIDFRNGLREITQMYIDEIKREKNKKKQQDWFEAFLLDLCQTVSELFNPKDVRVHFRYLNSNNTYVKLVSSYDNVDFNNLMTDIPLGKGMINKAAEYRSSLIKSLNPDYHFSGTNDIIWIDYITLVFPDFFINKNPLLTMGISIKNKDYLDTLVFYNYIKFEQIIQEEIKFLNSDIKIVDNFIKNHCTQLGVN